MKFLYLRRNELTEIPSVLFTIEELQILDLRQNHLTKVNCSPRWQHLTLLMISGNQIKELAFKEMSSLKTIQASDNQISVIKHVEDLKSCKVFDLKNNNIKFLPEEICSLKNLQKLYLDNNRITKLPDSLGDMSSLVTLTCNENELAELPQTIGDLKLARLELSFNRISVIPGEIGNMQSLRVLKLNDNNISFLPEEVGKLMNLRYLYLQGNPLTTAEKKKIKRLCPQATIFF